MAYEADFVDEEEAPVVPTPRTKPLAPVASVEPTKAVSPAAVPSFSGRGMSDMGEIASDFTKHQQRTKEFISDYNRLSQEKLDRSLAAASIPLPKTPDFIRPPPPPDNPEPTSAIEAFGSVASALGMIGALFTRKPLMTALKASASAMDAIRVRDQQAFERSFKEWKIQTDYVRESNDVLDRQYDAAIKKYEGDVGQQMMAVRAIAAAQGDKVILQQTDRGNFQDLMEVRKMRIDLNFKMGQEAARIQQIKWAHEDRLAGIEARNKGAASESIVGPIIERAKQEAIANGRGWSTEQEVMLRQQLMPQVAAAQARGASSERNAALRAQTTMAKAALDAEEKRLGRELKATEIQGTQAYRDRFMTLRETLRDDKLAKDQVDDEFRKAVELRKQESGDRLFALARERENRLVLSAADRKERDKEELRLREKGVEATIARDMANAKYQDRLAGQGDTRLAQAEDRLRQDKTWQETRDKYLGLNYTQRQAEAAATATHRKNLLEAQVGKANVKKIEHVREADVAISAIDDLTKFINEAPKAVAGGFGYGNVVLERVKDFVYGDPEAEVWASEVEQKMALLKFNALAFLKGYKPNRYDQANLENLIPGVDPKRGTAITLSGLRNLRGEIERNKNSVMGELRQGIAEGTGNNRAAEVTDDEYMDLITNKR